MYIERARQTENEEETGLEQPMTGEAPGGSRRNVDRQIWVVIDLNRWKRVWGPVHAPKSSGRSGPPVPW